MLRALLLALALVAAVDLPNGVRTTYAFDSADRLTGISHTRGAEVLASASYILDDAGNRKRETFQDGSFNAFGYDSSYRLETETWHPADGPEESRSFTYTDAGDRRTEKLYVGGVLTGTADYSYKNAQGVDNKQHQLQSITGLGKDASFEYDDDGNRVRETKSSGTTTYGFTFENRLLTASRNNIEVRRYYYQGDGWQRRTAVETDGGQTTTTNFLYDGDDVIAEYDGGMNLTAHNVTNGIDKTLWSVRGGNLQTPLAGAQNVMAVANAAGTITAQYRYRAFGERITLSGGSPARTDPTFQGRTYDQGLGIYDYRNRSFDPATGRFLQRDPVLGGDPLFNPYCFPGNNPVSNADPMGTFLVVPSQNIADFWRRTLSAKLGIDVKMTPYSGKEHLWMLEIGNADNAKVANYLATHQNDPDAAHIRALADSERYLVRGGNAPLLWQPDYSRVMPSDEWQASAFSDPTNSEAKVAGWIHASEDRIMPIGTGIAAIPVAVIAWIVAAPTVAAIGTGASEAGSAAYWRVGTSAPVRGLILRLAGAGGAGAGAGGAAALSSRAPAASAVSNVLNTGSRLDPSWRRLSLIQKMFYELGQVTLRGRFWTRPDGVPTVWNKMQRTMDVLPAEQAVHVATLRGQMYWQEYGWRMLYMIDYRAAFSTNLQSGATPLFRYLLAPFSKGGG